MRTARTAGATSRAASIVCGVVLCALLALGLAGCTRFGHGDRAAAQLAFGVDMAKRGLWNEALFRFRQAELEEPQNARIQNNLGVAYEAAGNFEKAREHYQKAAQLAPGDRDVRANVGRFNEFYQGMKSARTKGGGQAKAAPQPLTPASPTVPAAPAAPVPPPPAEPGARPGSLPDTAPPVAPADVPGRPARQPPVTSPPPPPPPAGGGS